MSAQYIEQMLYHGESPQDRLAFVRYLDQVKRGKSLLALIAMKQAMTPQIRSAWYEGSFTAIETSQGCFDELTCNLSYHFEIHGRKFGSIEAMTKAAKLYFKRNRSLGKKLKGKVKFPNGSIFMPDGRIITFF